jgi:hypothetical protein
MLWHEWSETDKPEVNEGVLWAEYHYSRSSWALMRVCRGHLQYDESIRVASGDWIYPPQLEETLVYRLFWARFSLPEIV